MTPAVCVAIPVKNGAAFLGATLDSVLAQEGVDLSVRIRDNGSDDDSVAIALAYAEGDQRVSVAVNEEDVTYYGSLNRIVAETDAEWFVPFAADDLMAPGNLAQKVEAAVEAGASFVHSSALAVDEDAQPMQVAPDHSATPRVVDPPGFFRMIAPNNMVSTQTVLTRPETLRCVAGFDVRGYYAGDWLTWMRIALRERVVTLPEPLVMNRVHTAGGTSTLNRQGINGRDVPATLEHVFSDDAMPAEWRAERDHMVATNLATVARILHEDGIRRVAQGWAGYMTLGRALARVPTDGGLRAAYEAYVSESDLAVPRLPFDAVTVTPESAADARALHALADRLGPLLASLAIVVDPDGVDDAMAVIEPVFGDTHLDVAIIPTADVGELLLPGRLAIARWGIRLRRPRRGGAAARAALRDAGPVRPACRPVALGGHRRLRRCRSRRAGSGRRGRRRRR